MSAKTKTLQESSITLPAEKRLSPCAIKLVASCKAAIPFRADNLSRSHTARLRRPRKHGFSPKPKTCKPSKLQIASHLPREGTLRTCDPSWGFFFSGRLNIPPKHGFLFVRWQRSYLIWPACTLSGALTATSAAQHPPYPIRAVLDAARCRS